MFKIPAERAILFLKSSVVLTACWPPSPKATRSHITLFEISWYVLFANTLFLLFPLINAIYENRNDSIVMTKSICLSCAVAQIALKMILCRLERSRFQVSYHNHFWSYVFLLIKPAISKVAQVG